MNLSTLLGRSLKSDEVIDVLEHFGVEVVYDFDRLHENAEDMYWASAPQAGFELRFNSRQALDTMFFFSKPRGKFLAIEPSISGVPFYDSFGDAKSAFLERGLAYREGGQMGWIKGDLGDHSVHYDFNENGTLSLVTLAASRSA
jgi:hypothetical protein